MFRRTHTSIEFMACFDECEMVADGVTYYNVVLCVLKLLLHLIPYEDTEDKALTTMHQCMIQV